MKISYNFYKNYNNSEDFILNVKVNTKTLRKKIKPESYTFVIDNGITNNGENLYIFKKTLKRIVKILRKNDTVNLIYAVDNLNIQKKVEKADFLGKHQLIKIINSIETHSSNIEDYLENIKKEIDSNIFVFTDKNYIKSDINIFNIKDTDNFEISVLNKLNLINNIKFSVLYKNLKLKIKNMNKSFKIKKVFKGETFDFIFYLNKKFIKENSLKLELYYEEKNGTKKNKILELKYSKLKYLNKNILEKIFFLKVEKSLKNYKIFIKSDFYLAVYSFNKLRKMVSYSLDENLVSYYEDPLKYLSINNFYKVMNINKNSNFKLKNSEAYILSKKLDTLNT